MCIMMKKEMDKTLTIAIVGEEYDSELVEFISNQDKLTLITTLSEHQIKQEICSIQLHIFKLTKNQFYKLYKKSVLFS